MFHVSHILWLASQEARPVVQLIFMLRFLSGALIAAGAIGALPWMSLVLTAACWLATTTTVYLVNGLSDVVEDSVNGSSRPIARGALPRRAASAVAGTTGAFAVILAVLTGDGWTLVLTLAMLGVGCAYSMGRKPLKNHMSGFLAAVVTGGMLTYLAGWNSVGTTTMQPELLCFGTAMALWMGFGGSTKDLPDVAGDQLAGRRTWPLVLGERRARLLMGGTALATSAGFALVSFTAVPALMLPATILLAGGVLLAVTTCSHYSRAERRARHRPYKVFMVTQYLAHSALFAQFTL